MEAMAAVERDCSAIGSLFQMVINDMKSGSQNWEDLVIKATKFHSQMKATIVASTAFLDAFQKIADMATSTRGERPFSCRTSSVSTVRTGVAVLWSCSVHAIAHSLSLPANGITRHGPAR